MVRKFSASQFRSQMRSAQNKANRELNKAMRDINSSVRKYNQEVRKYNASVNQNRARINKELRKLQSSTVTSTYTISVRNLNSAYEQVSAQYSPPASPSAFEDVFYTGVEQENANSLETANILNGTTTDVSETPQDNTGVIERLTHFSGDLNSRWQGALYSLNSVNPDAARHFCTSSREIFTEILETTAPDSEVVAVYPDCEKTKKGIVATYWNT